MRIRHVLPLLATAVLASAVSAADTPAAAPVEVKPYPLDYCLVSGDKLDAMGGAITWVYAGQEFKFCCKSCPKTFLKDPAALLAKLHAAEAGHTGDHPAPADGEHGGQHHE